MKLTQSKGIRIRLTEDQLLQLSPFDKIDRMIGKEGILSFDIIEQGHIIGFAMLRPYGSRSYFLWNYAIDVRWQGQGYGLAALCALADLMKTRYGADELSTTYLWGNKIAKRLCEKAGFIEEEVIEEHGIHEVDMTLDLSELA